MPPALSFRQSGMTFTGGSPLFNPKAAPSVSTRHEFIPCTVTLRAPHCVPLLSLCL
jgi:hypothetical protein